MSRERNERKVLDKKLYTILRAVEMENNNNMKIACWLLAFSFSLYCWLVSHNENIAQLQKKTLKRKVVGEGFYF